MGHLSRIFECMPAWDTGFVVDAGEDEEADTTIASLGTFVTPSTTQPRVTPSDLPLFFQPLHTSSLSRTLDVLMFILNRERFFRDGMFRRGCVGSSRALMMGTSKDRGR